LPWRLAVDRAWHGSRQAAGPLNLLAGFLGSVGVERLRAVYRLDGTVLLDQRWPFFLSALAAAVWAAPAPRAPTCGAADGELRTSPQEAYDALVASRALITDEGSYYNLAWRLLTMLLVTGNFPDDASLAAAGP
jgi:hypothetical protein